MRKQLATILVLFLIAGQTYGFDFINSRGVGLGRAQLMSRPTAAGLLNATTCSLGDEFWRFDGGYNRRFELSDLDHLYLAGAWRHRAFSVAFGASQFGRADLYAEQLLKGSLAWHHRWISANFTLSAMQVQIGNDYGNLRAASVGGGLAFKYRWFQLSIAADELNRPSLIEGALPRERRITFLTEVSPRESYSFTGRLTVEKLQKAQIGFGQAIELSDRGLFFWGISTEPTEFGGGIEFYVSSGSISYATSVHPVLGFTHTIGFSYGFNEPSTRRKGKEF